MISEVQSNTAVRHDPWLFVGNKTNMVTSFTLNPVRNSKLNEFRKLQLGTNFTPVGLAKAFQFGTLVDALITNPNEFIREERKLVHRSRYEQMTFFYSADEIELADKMVRAYVEHSILGKIHSYGAKHDFLNREFTFEFKGMRYLAHTGGELDEYAPIMEIGTDIKTTIAKTQTEFEKSMDKLFYDQQGSFYMDNLFLRKYIFAGISKTAIDPKTNLPAVFIIPFYPKGQAYEKGKERYTFWLYEYLKFHNQLIAA